MSKAVVVELLVVAGASSAGALVSVNARLAVFAVAGLAAGTCLVLLPIDTLVGIWLIGALFDPALPSALGFAPSDAVLVLALAKQARRSWSRRMTPIVAVTLAVAWLGEWLLLALGSGYIGSSARYLVTLASLTGLVWMGAVSGSWSRWGTWLIRASGVAAVLALFQLAVFKTTGTVIFKQPANLFFISTGISNVFRSTGLGTDPNFLGVWMLPGIGASAIAMIDGYPFRRWLPYCGLCVAGAWSTESRGAMAATALGLVVVMATRLSSPGFPGSRRVALACVFYGSAALALPTLVTVARGEIARYPITLKVRLGQVPVVFHDAISGNWFGNGHGAQIPNAMGIASAYLRQDNVIHNSLLQALFEVGWTGFIGVILLFGTGLYWSMVALREQRGDPRSFVCSPPMLGASFMFLAIGLQAVGGYFFRPLWLGWTALAIFAADRRFRRPKSAIADAPGAPR